MNIKCPIGEKYMHKRFIINYDIWLIIINSKGWTLSIPESSCELRLVMHFQVVGELNAHFHVRWQQFNHFGELVKSKRARLVIWFGWS